MGGVNGEKLRTLVGIQVIYGQVILSLMIRYEEEEGRGPQCKCLPSRGVRPPPGNMEDHETVEFTINGRAGELLNGVYAYKYSDLGAMSLGDEDMGDASSEEIEDLDDLSPEDIAVIRVRTSNLASVSTNTRVSNPA